jgi:hypothetical protein
MAFSSMRRSWLLPALRIRVYAAKIVLDDPYRPLGSDWWKWKKSSGSYLCLTPSKRS